MGLTVNTQYGTPVVHHGGDMIGFHSDMMWLPEHGVGAVILTNGDPGWLVRTVFRRKLLEVLFDGNPEADGQIAAAAKTFFDELAAERKLLTVPADAGGGRRSSPAHYANPALGAIVVSTKGAAHDLRLRRVVERGGVAQEPRRHDLVHHDRARASTGSSSSPATGR